VPDATAPPRHSRATTLVLAFGIVVTLVLVWRVIASGAAALLARSGADVLGSSAPLETRAPDAQWRERLAVNPTDYPALVILALQLERQGKNAEAAGAMREAMRLAPADARTLLEAAGFHLRTGDEAAALTILRRTVELNPGAAGTVWPLFASVLDSGRRDDFFAAAARDNAWWFPAFFLHACRTGANTDAVLRAFGMRAASEAITPDERKCMIERLERENRWAQAYQSWINSMPRQQRGRIGYVFNGDFEAPLSNVGFDWIAAPQDGVNVEAQSIQGANGRRALRVEFVRKRWARSPVAQYLMLAPGKYRLEGRGRADGLDTWVGVQWGLHCRQEDGKPVRQLAQSERFRGTSDWVSFHDDFAVGKDCPVQVLRLELANPRQDLSTPADVVTRLNGNVWFDDFRIRSLD
jgi:hypothetical protein